MPKTTYMWDELSDNVAAEYENGVLAVGYTHEPGLYGNLLSQNRNGVTSYYHYDGRGDTVALTDDAGNVTDTKEYDAWGNVITSTGSTVTPYQFVGRQGYQNSQSRIYVRGRMYDPINHRWSSVDPIQPLTESNWFTYALNSPILRIDSAGLISMSVDAPRSLGCNDLNNYELQDLSTCGPANSKCDCNLWSVGPKFDPINQTVTDPFEDMRIIAQPVCLGGKLVVKINPNRIQALEEEPYNIPNPIGLLELYSRLGVANCLIAHEMHHIAQYNCFCPDLCKMHDGVVTMATTCAAKAECWAYSGQINCMMKAACAAFHRGRLDGQQPNQVQRNLFDEIMQLIDAWGEIAQTKFCGTYANIEEITKNTRNWKELKAGRPCRPPGGE